MFPSDPPPSGSGFHALLKNRPFMVLWVGQILSQIADKVFFVLLIALLSEYQFAPEMENSMRSALMVAFTLPAILFGSAAGVFVDRFPKKKVMVASDLLRFGLTILIPLLPQKFSILLVITFLSSAVTQFFAPAEQAAIPLMVRRENLMTANALFTTTMMGSLIVGFAVGEPVLSLARSLGGESSQEFLVGGFYLLAAIISMFVKIKDPAVINPQAAINPISDLKAGLRYLWQNRLVRNAMFQLVILYSVFAALTVLAIDLSEKLGLKSEQFGFLLASAGVGMVLGAGILGHWGDRFHQKPLPLFGFLSMAFVLGVFSFTHRLWLGLGLSAFLGLGASLIGVPMQTLIHQQTSESMRGKVFGFQNNVVNIALSLPLAIAGPLTDKFGLRGVLLAMSIVVSVVGIWAWQNTRNVLKDAI
ncbi:MFS transporter [Funiculus sociatus GB2-A5]|uniref:MFS transporter n=1 Tax=Funiculus sociatus GB2-A5 TaxID=2933946 RepID=A0ABV0JMT5_9CYAN|nr:MULTISPECIES: MFS transporter [unclassified Trichocoleus]MBD1905860.1 MFS transporter [Trichocoleus sp. FACHB-832]MBD2065419.1 MFS transporter [Trichocoleus sp. FACHB-6]